MKSLNSILLLFTLLLFGGSLSAQMLQGSGPMETRTLDIEGFSGLELGMNADVYVSVGAYGVKVKGQANILDRMRTDVVNGTWRIKLDANRVGRHERVEIWVSAPSYDKIALSGSGNIIGEDKIVTRENMYLSLSGSGNISLEMESPEVTCKISGSGNINVSGSSQTSNISITGSGDIRAEDLRVAEARASITGSGDIDIHVTDQLNAQIVGSGSVRYKGQPKVNTQITGSGKVRSM